MTNYRRTLDQQLIKKLYLEDKLTAPVIAEQLGCSSNTIYRILSDLGIQPKGFGRTGARGSANRKYPSEIEQQIAKEYSDGKSIATLAEKYKVCTPTIKRYLKKSSIKIRGKGGVPRPVASEIVEQIVNLYKSGLSQIAISERMHIHQTRISKILSKAGIESHRKVNMKGENHPSWKGGKSARFGYMLVHIKPEDPMFKMANASGYVFEHRLVMAKHLGRPLEEYEYVHHINGVRDDNRLENLQLVRSQPKGQILCCADCGSKNLVPEEF